MRDLTALSFSFFFFFIRVVRRQKKENKTEKFRKGSEHSISGDKGKAEVCLPEAGQMKRDDPDEKLWKIKHRSKDIG